MQQFRLTKYDPQHRNESGDYLVDEWTEFSDIGKAFNGIVLTLDVYENIERNYIETACQLLGMTTIQVFSATDIEGSFPCDIDQKSISITVLPNILRGLLRNEFWCRLITHEGFYIHIGRDYYMYLGLPGQVESATEIAKNNGLFLEPSESPYLRLD